LQGGEKLSIFERAQFLAIPSDVRCHCRVIRRWLHRFKHSSDKQYLRRQSNGFVIGFALFCLNLLALIKVSFQNGELVDLDGKPYRLDTS
jgi:hypothetical protein